MSERNELTPEVKAALKTWRRDRHQSGMNNAALLADAFAALFPEPPPELQLKPGIYECDACVAGGEVESSWLIVADDLTQVVVSKHDGLSENNSEWNGSPLEAENIRRIDDGAAAWRAWAAKERGTWGRLGHIMNCASWSLASSASEDNIGLCKMLREAAAELEALLNGDDA